MSAVHLRESNIVHQDSISNTVDNYCLISQLAIHAINAVGLLLLAAGIGCVIAGLQFPALALLVTGAAALVLGFVLAKSDPIKEVLTPAIAFGKEAWIQHIGDPGKVPPLPADIETILSAPCPFLPEQSVRETHVLVLIPKTVTRVVDGENVAVSVTLKTLDELVKASNNGAGIGYEHIQKSILEAYGDRLIEESHWVLMTKEVIPNSRDKDVSTQKQLVEAMGYKVPSCLEAAACILLQNVRSEMRLFSKESGTYTCCEETIQEDTDNYPVTVGGFSSQGLIIRKLYFPHHAHGVAGVKLIK